MVWVPMQAWGSVNKVDNIPDGERPTDTSGYNYLLVGSDSREGLTKEQRKKYATGNAAGNRTDTIMLVHVSESGGKPVMVSLPRDSYVPIPGHGSNKINAAYSIGGPEAAHRRPSRTSPASTSTATSRSASAASPPSSTASAASTSAWRAT